MVVRQSPGVYVTEIDRSLGMSLVGTGGIGIASKLNKGVIGKAFGVVSESDFISKAGLPVPSFNLVGWHSVSNILRYAEGVAVSRVENVDFGSTHTSVKQKLQIPVNTGQLGLFLTGNAVNFDFDSELQDMIKNREKFKSTNEQNRFDVLNEDDGINISELDGAMLIQNDDILEEYVENSAFNTKAKSLKYLPKLGYFSVTKDDYVPALKVGQVYNHNGKIVEIGNDIYNDTVLIELTNGDLKEGSGTISWEDSSVIISGVGTSFLSELKVDSKITASWFNAPVAITASDLVRSSTNFKTLTVTDNYSSPVIKSGAKITIGTISRIVAEDATYDDGKTTIILTTDAPSAWGSDFQTSWSYMNKSTDEQKVSAINDDNQIEIESAFTGLPASTNATFEYKRQDSVSANDGIPAVESIYRDETDVSGKTIIGINANFHTLLRVGSKIVVDFGGGDVQVRFVESIPETGINKVVLTEPFSDGQLPVDISGAKEFKYANFYFNADNAGIGKKIYTATGEGIIVASDELNNTPDNIFRYIVKVTSGTFTSGSTVNLAKLNSDEWTYFAETVYRVTEMSRENNYYIMKYTTNALTIERDDTIYFNADKPGGVTAMAKVLMASDEDITNLNMLVEILTGDPYGETIKIGDSISLDDSGTYADGEITFIHCYEDVILYETEEHTGDMVMVNETVVGLTPTMMERYTYTYNYTGTETTDKQDYVIEDSVTGTYLASTEFMRIFAITPGAWINDDNVSVAICDMEHFNAGATIEDGGIAFRSLFEFPPDTDDKTLMCVAVIKDDLVVERYIVSTNPASKDSQNSSQYIIDVINQKSSYIRVILNTGIFNQYVQGGYNIHFNTVYNTKIDGGYSGKLFELYRAPYYRTESTANVDVTNGYVTNADVFKAYEVFQNKDDIAISYLVDGEWCGNAIIANKLVDICYNRNDAVAILGPNMSDIIGIKDTSIIKNNMLNYVNNNSLIGGDRFFQFAGFFANCKQIYDVYNETYVWLPISVDVAGLNESVDRFFEPWYAVAGMTRGAIRNIIKLGWNPTRLERDALYPNRINPVVYFKGEGTYVYGVRTLCSLKSDLADMYNRKTLNFIAMNLEKFLRQVLFEFNDAITRGQVVNNIEPFLRNITAKRGLIDYQIICDETNNPLSVVENNELICNVYLKMAHVIETVSLNFIITKASVSFDEVRI
jgi:hypothetical protein